MKFHIDRTTLTCSNRSEGASFSAVDLSGEEEKKMYTPGQTCTKPPVLTAMSPVRVSPTGLA